MSVSKHGFMSEEERQEAESRQKDELSRLLAENLRKQEDDTARITRIVKEAAEEVDALAQRIDGQVRDILIDFAAATAGETPRIAKYVYRPAVRVSKKRPWDEYQKAHRWHAEYSRAHLYLELESHTTDKPVPLIGAHSGLRLRGVTRWGQSARISDFYQLADTLGTAIGLPVGVEVMHEAPGEHETITSSPIYREPEEVPGFMPEQDRLKLEVEQRRAKERSRIEARRKEEEDAANLVGLVRSAAAEVDALAAQMDPTIRSVLIDFVKAASGETPVIGKREFCPSPEIDPTHPWNSYQKTHQWHAEYDSASIDVELQSLTTNRLVPLIGAHAGLRLHVHVKWGKTVPQANLHRLDDVFEKRLGIPAILEVTYEPEDPRRKLMARPVSVKY